MRGLVLDSGFRSARIRALHGAEMTRSGGAYYVYLLASRRNGTLYLGMTNDIVRRVSEHRLKLLSGFTSDYDVRNLVWYECYPTAMEAITAEKDMKKWRREWKLAVIERANPAWRDLWFDITGDLSDAR